MPVLVAAAVAASVLAGCGISTRQTPADLPPPAAAAPPTTTPPAGDFCTYWKTIAVPYALARPRVDSDLDAQTALLWLSPAVEVAYLSAAAETPDAAARAALTTEAAVHAKGAGLLAEAGISDETVAGIRSLESLVPKIVTDASGRTDQWTDPNTGVTVDDATAARVVGEFMAAFKGVDQATRQKADTTMDRLGDACEKGATDAAVDVCATVSPATVTRLLGKAVDGTSGVGDLGTGPMPYCRWEADRDNEIAVTMLEARQYVEAGAAQGVEVPSVPGLGDRAWIGQGFAYGGGGGSSGRTVYVLDGDRALMVALDLAAGKPTDAQLTGLAEEVLSGK